MPDWITDKRFLDVENMKWMEKEDQEEEEEERPDIIHE